MAGTKAKKESSMLSWSKAEFARWSRAPRIATLECGEGRSLLLLKAPLAERYEELYGGEASVFTVHMVVERVLRKKKRLAVCVDATLRSSHLHDVRDWDDWDVSHVSLGARRGPAPRCADAAPRRSEVDAALDALREAWRKPCVAAVYSLDGCNTPGLVAVSALVELTGAAPVDALAAVAAVRPIFSAKHIDWLRARYPALDALAPAPKPDWVDDGDGGDDEPPADSDDETAADLAAAAAPAPAPAPAPTAAAAPASDGPKPKRARLQGGPAATATADFGDARAHRLFVVAPEGKRTLLASLESKLAIAPADLESTHDGYDKDLAKVATYPSFDAKVTSDQKQLAEFCKYLVGRKKAAIISRGSPRIYLPPQALADGTITLRYRKQ